MPTNLADVIAVLEQSYPPASAEDWDTGIGLTCGDPGQRVDSVLLAVDVDPRTVDEAIAVGAQLLLTHHPMLFRPVQSVAADTAKGALIHRLIRSGTAHFAAHTNADRAVGGVNDALAETLGLTELQPLNQRQLGRIGTLRQPCTAAEFAGIVASSLPATATGARLAGDPERTIRRVAVCGGSGGSLLPELADANVDAFVTADLGHHVVAEFVADPTAPVIVDVAHWASEWPWLDRAAAVLRQALGVRCTVSTLRTDSWTLRAG